MKRIDKFSQDGQCFSNIMRVEDLLHKGMVFIAGFGNQENPRASSMMAYGTIIDYAQFDKVWETIKDDYSPDCWREMSKYWIYQHYLSPTPVLIVALIFRKLGLPYRIEPGKFIDETEERLDKEKAS